MKNFFRENYLITLLIIITFVKGAVWAAAMPLFQTPDEQFHYATIQYYALPKGYQPKSNDFPLDKITLDDVNSQNLSPELKNFLDKTDFARIRFKPDNQMSFADNSPFGIGEKDLRNQNLSRYVERFPPWYSSYSPLYYKTMSFVENALSGHNIIERVFSIRLFSVILGTLLVLCAYFIFRELYLDKVESVILAGIVSFQPMLTFINSSINVDPLLFFAFAIFILGSVRVLRNKIDIWSVAFILAGIILGINTKPPGYFMPVALFFLVPLYFLLHYRDKIATPSWKKNFFWLILSSAVAMSAIYFMLKSYFPNVLKPLLLLPKYLLFELKYQPSLERSLSYWGNFGWVDTNLSRFFIFSIWILSIVAAIGIAKYFLKALFLKSHKKTEKARLFFFQLLFFLIFVVGISFMIHFVNLELLNPNNVADQSASISTQGRYFFPSLIPRLALLAFGFVFLLPKIRRKWIFMTLLIGMIFLNIWSLLDLVIPRYYL